MKKKGAEEVLEAFKSWGVSPKICDSDHGTEWGGVFAAYCAEHGIAQLKKHPRDVNALAAVDRKCQQIKNLNSGHLMREKQSVRVENDKRTS